MADITVTCAKCGKENKVSEFVASKSVNCKSCGQPLEIQVQTKQTRLQMRHIGDERGDSLRTASKGTSARTGALPTSGGVSSVLGDVHKAREKQKNPLAFWAWLAFLALTGLLVGAQYYIVVIDPQYTQYYMYGRLAIWGFIALLVLIVAFEDSTGQGLFCLFVPLYIVYYAFMRVEYYWLRGLFFAVVISMGSELYYMPQEAALTKAQVAVNKFIVGTADQMDRLSREPEGQQKFRYGRGNKRIPINNPSRPARPKNLPRR